MLEDEFRGQEAADKLTEKMKDVKIINEVVKEMKKDPV